ncbi:MAG: hypothetical protein AB8B69_24765 [Chitinophagales bacterium]
MNNISIEFSTHEILKLARQLPQEIKQMLITEWSVEQSTSSKKQIFPSFQNFPDFNKPIQLQNYVVEEKNLEGLVDLWEDELPAEELCKMLTK